MPMWMGKVEALRNAKWVRQMFPKFFFFSFSPMSGDGVVGEKEKGPYLAAKLCQHPVTGDGH